MAFNPTSTIILCNVPIDNTYKNQIYFSSESSQRSYFLSRAVRSFNDYLTVRKTLPNGSLQSSVKVAANIDDLYVCNYMCYQNQNHGTKWFYAFITNLIYINEGTTEVVFETDVYQTWRFNADGSECAILKDSFVEREHSVTDKIGDSRTPEQFKFSEYDYHSLASSGGHQWGYLITTNKAFEGEGLLHNGKIHSGIYQGLHFYYVTDPLLINILLRAFEDEQENVIQSITVIPKTLLSKSTIKEVFENTTTQGLVESSIEPSKEELVIDFSARAFTFDGYEPDNNKLYTGQFAHIYAHNGAGGEGVYYRENFLSPDYVVFNVYGDVSPSPSMILVPKNYNNIADNMSESIALSGFPQCSYYNDAYTMWLARNSTSAGINMASSSATMGMGVALALSGVGALAGVGMIVGGATGIANSINSMAQASHNANPTNLGKSEMNLITAMKMNRFILYYRTIKREFAEMVDNYFTMFGYATNKTKVPNVNSRPYFNYVKTIDVNIVGGIPNDDMARLKQMYNDGVTLWKPTATVGDYSVDNRASVR